jgi:hypothetical protein
MPKGRDTNWLTDPASGRILARALTLAAALVLPSIVDASETPYGVQLRERLEAFDRWCLSEKLGPYNTDPAKAHITTCDTLFLKDKHWHPNETEESRYAHSIKLPSPHDKPQVEYRPGMTSKQFFDELCAKEAGEWVFGTSARVEGIYLARTLTKPLAAYSSLVFDAVEPLWTAAYGMHPENYFVQPTLGRYRFLEVQADPDRPVRSSGAFTRFVRDDARPTGTWTAALDGRAVKVPYVVRKDSSGEARAQYMVVARGVRRAHFADHAISGAEVLIVDYSTGAVMGLLRSFSQFRPTASRGSLVSQVAGESCATPPGRPTPSPFIYRVAVPVD